MATVQEHKHTNRLIKEKSPYLLQHAHNPVDWYPWGEEAFAKAREEKKPIFLSVGYSTCHWCHVMEHESFENEEVAKVMNAKFVNIKVDREEQPGVDRMYMTYVQLTSGGGGWPMSVFLTPELYPFFGATYFPPEDQMGRPGFKSILKRISQLWTTNPVKVREAGNDTIEQIKSYIETSPASGAAQYTSAIADKLYKHFHSKFDAAEGGFGGAPKFATPVQFVFLLHHSAYAQSALSRAEIKGKPVDGLSVTELRRAANEFEADLKGCVEKKDFVEVAEKATKEIAERALEMVLFTLKKIAAGGVHDHVGKGFHRYSTDKFWHVPHFEKMLYDQAQLLSVYVTAYSITKDNFYAEIARDIVKYVDRDLSHSEGGFYSAEDADSFPYEGASAKKEGAFCVWEQSELRTILPELDAGVFSYHYGVRDGGNVNSAQDPHGELKNKNVLIEKHTVEETASEYGLTIPQVRQMLKDAKDKLWEVRATKRPKPHRDDKILTSWNGLMISGLAQSYSVLGDKRHLEIAISAANFIKQHMYNVETHTLLRSYREGPSEVEGFLDDYSYLVQALLDLYEATFDEAWLHWAVDLQERQNELFWDVTGGGYFSVTEKDTTILVRMKDKHDGAEPSGNSVSVSNLLRLANIIDEPNYTQKAERTLLAFHTTLTNYPQAMPAMVTALLLFLRGTKQIILLGPLDHETVKSFLHVIRDTFLPNRVLLYARPNGLLAQRNEAIVALVQTGEQEIAAVHVCENFACGLPVYDIEELKTRL